MITPVTQPGRSGTGTSTQAPESQGPRQSHPQAFPTLRPLPSHWQLVQILAATQDQCQGQKYLASPWQPWVWRTAPMDRDLRPRSHTFCGPVMVTCAWRSQGSASKQGLLSGVSWTPWHKPRRALGGRPAGDLVILILQHLPGRFFMRTQTLGRIRATHPAASAGPESTG